MDKFRGVADYAVIKESRSRVINRSLRVLLRRGEGFNSDRKASRRLERALHIVIEVIFNLQVLRSDRHRCYRGAGTIARSPDFSSSVYLFCDPAGHGHTRQEGEGIMQRNDGRFVRGQWKVRRAEIRPDQWSICATLTGVWRCTKARGFEGSEEKAEG